jgi:hypothetical protein
LNVRFRQVLVPDGTGALDAIAGTPRRTSSIQIDEVFVDPSALLFREMNVRVGHARF